MCYRSCCFQPESAESFHRQIAATLLRHHRSVNRNGREIQPVSPATYSSSMEVKSLVSHSTFALVFLDYMSYGFKSEVGI